MTLVFFASFVQAQENNVVIGIPVLDNYSSNYSIETRVKRLQQFIESYWGVVSEQSGIGIQFVYATRPELVEGLKNGNVDVITISSALEVNSGFLYSIPYAYVASRLYKRIGEKHLGRPVAIDLPTEMLPRNFNFSQNAVHHSNDLDQVMGNANYVNFLYSWNPEELTNRIENSELSKDFVIVDDSKGAPLRFMVSEENSELLVRINHDIRTTDQESVIKRWEVISGQRDSFLDIRVGTYYSNVPDALQAYIAKQSIFTFAYIESGEEPYFISDNFKLEGYIIDILEGISDTLGVSFRGKPYPSFQSALEAVKRKDVDLFPGIYKTENRALYLDFTTPIDKVFVSIVSSGGYSSISELEGKKIALVRGVHENEFVSTIIPTAPFSYYDTAEEAINAVAQGKAEAFVGKLLNSIYLVDKNKHFGLYVHTARDVETELWPRISFGKGAEYIGDIFNLGIHALGDTFQQEIAQQWRRSVEANYTGNQNHRLFRQTLLIFICFSIITLIGIGIYRNQLKKRVVVQKTLEDALEEAESAKRAAEEMALAKSDFLARMSHEIRTPMNGVLGMAEALSFTQLDKEQTDLLMTLNGSARNLMALLNDVLDFSKMDAGKLTLEQIDCNIEGLLEGVRSNFIHKAKVKGLSFDYQIDPKLQQSYICDSTRLMQVLNNLVSNSVKFTQEGYVELTAQLICTDHSVAADGCSLDLVGFQVRDSGIGIKKAQLTELFDPFVQADGDITRRFGGTGLGLSISNEIISEMGGEIKVSSVFEHGSLFSILLPMKKNQELVSSINEELIDDDCSGVDDLSNLYVLFAEDNEVNRKVIGGQLKRLGVKFDTAVNGAIALEMYSKNPSYDLILSDCHMPEMDGFTLAGNISSTRNGTLPYLIAITADALSGAAKRCLSAGFDDYISKPCPLDVLQAKLVTVSKVVKPQLAQKIKTDTVSSYQEEETVESPDWLEEFEVFDEPTENRAEKPLKPDVECEPKNDVNVDWLSIPSDVETEENSARANDRETEELLHIEWLEEQQSGAEIELKALELSSLDHLLAELEVNSESEVTSITLNLPKMQSFDVSHVLDMSGGDEGITREILQTFRDNYQLDIQALNEVFRSGNLDELKDIAHRIKGSALYLGSEGLAEVAKDLEYACAENNSEFSAQRVEYLVNNLDLLGHEVSDYCSLVTEPLEQVSQ